MKIKADKEGIEKITAVCDVARKVCELSQVKLILDIVDSIEEIEDEDTKVPE